MDYVLNVDVNKISTVANVGKNMAYKYLNGYSLPRLDKAILLEKELKIPVSFWVENKKKRKGQL